LRVYINGESREFPDPLSLDQLIEQLALPAVRIAIELNREVVRRSDWPSARVQEGDRIEIVHFVGGG
jgi:thiamine biosynthesis protein ThiS